MGINEIKNGDKLFTQHCKMKIFYDLNLYIYIYIYLGTKNLFEFKYIVGRGGFGKVSTFYFC